MPVLVPLSIFNALPQIETAPPQIETAPLQVEISRLQIESQIEPNPAGVYNVATYLISFPILPFFNLIFFLSLPFLGAFRIRIHCI